MRGPTFTRRRLLGFGLAAVVLATVAAVQPKSDPPKHVFRVTFGLKDQKPTSWSGKVAASEGEVAALSPWRFENPDAVEGTSSWKCATHDYIEPGARNPVLPAPGKPRPAPAPLEPWPLGIDLTVLGARPSVTLTLDQGEVQFDAQAIHLGEPKLFLDGRVRVERLPDAVALRPAARPNTPNPVQDDYPAFWVRYKTGKQYLAWVAYQGEKDRVLLAERDGADGAWSEPKEVAGPGDHFRVALANTHGETFWLVWSEQREGKWNLFARSYKDSKLGDEQQLTQGAGPNIYHRMVTDGRGRAWLVWQGFHDGQSDIFARCADGDGWHEPIQVSTSKANDWAPCLTADPKEDRIWVGWDTYATGSYNVRVRSISGGPQGKLGEELTPETTPLYRANVSLACDRSGHLWAAWEESGPQWGKDTGYLYQSSPATRLYASREIRVKCLVDGKWLEPAGELAKVLTPEPKEYNQLPQLQEDTEGRMWLAFRHRTCRMPRADGWAAQGRWDSYATAYIGDHWTEPVELPHSAGHLDMRLSSQRDPDGNVYFAYASDNRSWLPPAGAPRNLNITVSKLNGAPKAGELQFAERQHPIQEPAQVHPNEKEQFARIRAYKLEAAGKTYHIYRGDLHRHTEFSSDGVGDGSVLDLHRYALDAAALDYVLVGDHNMGQDNEYCWWMTQKANDLYTVPGAFISMYGYERSVPYPNGHRNIIWTERGHRTLPLPRANIPAAMAADTGKLYDYLRRTGGICTLHTSATDQGTDWQEHDDTLEPFVEIFQGYHGSYEANGAPKAIDENSDIIHGRFRPDGYVDLALAKGYRLGFQSSSDHISTHVSYACILAENFTRKGLVDAMRKRHSYAATDNIVLDVRMGTLGIMGDEVRTAEPQLDVVVLGTGPIERLDVVREDEVVHTARPEKEAAETRFTWKDPKPRKGDKPTYYYVRVQQKDGQMAWSSPIWVKGVE